jgi:4-hydroxy-tetrahydrodipicolinate synthase
MSDIQQGGGTGSGAGARHQLFGISAALTTPFRDDLSVDLKRMVAHARALLEEGCASVTLFGTTGEGPSLSRAERAAAQDALIGAGITPDRIVVGLNGVSVEAAVEQAESALVHGIRTFLVPPPYYFKGVSDSGLFSWFSSLLERIAGHGARVILYHIPQVTGIGLSLALVRRLKEAYPETVFGVKDSAGHWPTTEAFLSLSDLAVLVGDERHLAAAARLGGAGAISGMANLFPALLADLIRTGKDNAEMNALVDAIVRLPVTPAVKALVGVKLSEQGWERVRAPLEPTPAADVETLGRLLRGLNRKRAA